MRNNSNLRSGGSAMHGASDVARYHLARELLPLGTVLDDGCGYGNGTSSLITENRTVIGIDPDQRAIKHARRNTLSNNLRFLHKTMNLLPFTESSIDGVISLEVIEHLPDQQIYIDEIARVLKSRGVFVISTPNKYAIEQFYQDGLSPLNITHVHELYPNELLTLLNQKFELKGTYVCHSSNLAARKSFLEYQKSFILPYRIRSKIPMKLKSVWTLLKGFQEEEWLVEQVNFDDIAVSSELRFEDIILYLERR